MFHGPAGGGVEISGNRALDFSEVVKQRARAYHGMDETPIPPSDIQLGALNRRFGPDRLMQGTLIHGERLVVAKNLEGRHAVVETVQRKISIRIDAEHFAESRVAGDLVAFLVLSHRHSN